MCWRLPGLQVDHWALGVCMYQWAYGRLPFSGGTVLETFAAISGTEPPDAPPDASASAALQDVIAQVSISTWPGP
jgi:serine/threonine protein kinase